jgi:hypothetical protein
MLGEEELLYGTQVTQREKFMVFYPFEIDPIFPPEKPDLRFNFQ